MTQPLDNHPMIHPLDETPNFERRNDMTQQSPITPPFWWMHQNHPVRAFTIIVNTEDDTEGALLNIDLPSKELRKADNETMISMLCYRKGESEYNLCLFLYDFALEKCERLAFALLRLCRTINWFPKNDRRDLSRQALGLYTGHWNDPGDCDESRVGFWIQRRDQDLCIAKGWLEGPERMSLRKYPPVPHAAFMLAMLDIFVKEEPHDPTP